MKKVFSSEEFLSILLFLFVQAKLQEIFPELSITVAKKADSTYPVVSAASICAKVSRDVALKVWQCPEINSDKEVVLGCGYPGGMS